MPEEGSGNSMSSSGGKGISGKEEALWQDMTKEELLAALAGAKQETYILYTQKILLRQLTARLNEENEMLLTLWEEAEKKYENAKDAYDKLWQSYEQIKGLYETLRKNKSEKMVQKKTPAK